MGKEDCFGVNMKCEYRFCEWKEECMAGNTAEGRSWQA
jgi:hypothetical protein